ncbi:cytochrome b/b6 domain-containing protein [Massilia glaciei]|uniref:Cytochrome B n=1 Tax=Massilia glaciei TaxID=1524097 RepID=A0A2U2HEM9_9BURK|nr:cytochrome b/b6 domain-containing protein [Massilia glaciei]PWF42093.1 cytochrome B [Massilia glaciei]
MGTPIDDAGIIDPAPRSGVGRRRRRLRGDGTVLVWDAPLRMANWLMMLSFAGAYFSAGHADWELVHLTFGYTLAGLVGFRILWGLVGTRHARFASFVRGPGAVLRHLRKLLAGRPERHTGHTPTGALAILAMLGLALAIAATGWMLDTGRAGEFTPQLHQGLANLMLIVALAHLASVFLTGWMHRQRLVAAMLHGRKRASPDDSIARSWRSLALLLLAAALCFWWLQWQGEPIVGDRANQTISLELPAAPAQAPPAQAPPPAEAAGPAA